MHELRDVGRGRGQAFSWCQDIRKIEAKNVRQIRAFGANEGKALSEPSVPAAAPRAAASTAAGDDTLRNRIEPMEEEGAVGESEEEEEGAVVDVGVSDSEEELEVLQQPNLIQKLAVRRRCQVTCAMRDRA